MKDAMIRKYFGTDGIRGKVGEAPITPDFVLRVGYAAGNVLTRTGTSGERPVVLIGKDTRISGYMLESALEAGLSAAGGGLLPVWPMPPPAAGVLTAPAVAPARTFITAAAHLQRGQRVH